MSSVDASHLAWLALFCAPPLVIALLFAIRRHTPADSGPIRLGNPLFKAGTPPLPQEAALRPLLELTRTQSDADLRALILGLRHLPPRDTAFILRRYQHSDDPELQLYSQCALQESQESLQAIFSRLLPRAAQQAPAILASCIETGLSLAASPLTPEAERAAVLRKLFPKADAVRQSGLTHPRAVHAAARFCLVTHQIEPAEQLCRRLPAGSPLHESLTALLRHHAPILHPPPKPAPRYSIH
jgi:hypothetical protein